MKHGPLVAAGALALLATAVGCSNGSGIFGENLPAGNITVADATTGQTLTTSAANPYAVQNNALRFSLAISEDRFGGPYAVTVVKQQNVPSAANGGNVYPYSFNLPCFVPHQGSEFGAHANVIVFSGDNANANLYNFPSGGALVPPPATAANPMPSATPLPPGNPCHSGELEVAQISDNKGHSVLFYYEEEP